MANTLPRKPVRRRMQRQAVFLEDVTGRARSANEA